MPLDLSLHEIDGEPRMRDLGVAEALGFADRHMIRRLIQRHYASLAQFGEVSVTATETSASGGRPGTTYWLNEEQALFVATRSETPRALDVTREMVLVFAAWRRGEAPPPAERGGTGLVIFPPRTPVGAEALQVDERVACVAQVRMAYRIGGRVAAARMWDRLPLEPLELGTDDEVANDPDVNDLVAFLQERASIVGGDALTPVSDVLAAFAAWQAETGRPAWPPTVAARRLSRLAGVYRDPSTGLRFVRAKSSVMVCRGLVLRPVD